MDLPVQEKLRALMARAYQRDAEMLSVMGMPNWKGIKLEHARHYVWLTNHDEVLREMKTFLETF